MKSLSKGFIVFLSLFFFGFTSYVYADTSTSGTPSATSERLKEAVKDAQTTEKLTNDLGADKSSPVAPLDEGEDFSRYSDEKLVVLQEVKHNQSDILSSSEIESVYKEFISTEVSLRDLYKITARINMMYKQRGAMAAVAILPQQDITDGVVELQLIEGKVGAINVTGAKYTKKDFVLSRLGIKSGDSVNAEKLSKKILRLNMLYDIKVRASLKAGSEFGTTDIDIEVVEPDDADVVLFTDNAGKDDIGLYRGGVIAIERSLLANRDAISIGGVKAEGTDNAFISYDTPINRFGTHVTASADYSRTEVKSGDLKDLDIMGDYYGYGADIIQPLWVNAKFMSNIYGGYKRKNSSSEFDGYTTFETMIDSYNYGFNFTRYFNKAVVYADNMITTGTDRHDATRDFLRYNLSIDYLWNFYKEQRITFKVRCQIADSDLLPSSEQFQIGGSNSVRGYTEGLLIGDNGYSMNLEYDFSLGKKFRPFGFVDYGQTFQYKGDAIRNSNYDNLCGVGVGTHIYFTENTRADITVGVPLIDHPYEEDDGVKFLYYLQTKF